ncbi:hypothetical protein EV368DRAFT_28043, partial [Lentinula lateritia]
MFLVTVMHGHPNEDQVNHTLQKVVDELLLLWDGVFYTRTAKYSRGRTVRAALVPAVCDTQGAHTLSGFASHRHTLFCIRCLLPIQEIHNLDPATWPRRDLESHRTYANLWRDAASKAIRDTLFNKYGVRWTEMLRLPYWNPIVYTIIDSMHLGYLGLFATHIRRIWKMNAEALKSGEGYVQPSSEKKRKKPSNSFLRKLFNAIRDNKLSLKKTLSDQTQGVLWYLCYDLNLPSAGTKDILVNTILEWEIKRQLPPASKFTCPAAGSGDFDSDPQYRNLVERLGSAKQKMPGLSKARKDMLKALCSGLGIYYNEKQDRNADIMARNLILWVTWYLLPEIRGIHLLPFQRRENRESELIPKASATSRHVIAKDILDEIWKDMKITILPSWIDAPRENWGTKAAGKLSADEWKVVCSISLVITLIRLWGYEYEDQPQARHFQMLLNFLDLVKAIRLLNLRETSSRIQAEYSTLILKYLRNVLVLFPDVNLASNHHYAVHAVEDLKLMGPVQARNTPVFERINHLLQEINSNNHSGEIEVTMLNTFCRQGALEMILEYNVELRDDIREALEALQEMKRESHRGM